MEPKGACCTRKMAAYLDELGSRFPGLGELIERIKHLRFHAEREREPFFEHRSLLVLEDGKPRLAGVVAADFNAWRHHMADGSSVRMRALEVGTAAELAAGRMISAMATARAHMEVAGLAAYCVERYTTADAAVTSPRSRSSSCRRTSAPTCASK